MAWSNMSELIDELYNEVNRLAEELSEELGRQVSIREALVRLVESKGLDPSDFAWSWRMNAMIRSENQSEKKSLKIRPDS